MTVLANNSFVVIRQTPPSPISLQANVVGEYFTKVEADERYARVVVLGPTDPVPSGPDGAIVLRLQE